jgi:hypothetical protein
LILATTIACASVRLPSPAVVEAARGVKSYSATLSVKVSLRGRLAAIVAFERPDRLYLEVPGPTGAGLVVVAQGGRLTAVFPAERAVFEGDATERVLGEVLGVALAPSDVMDFLVGMAPATVRGYRADWGLTLPQRVRGRLADGTRLDVRVKEPQAGGTIDDRAFAAPAHEGYRSIDAAEARAIWSGR